MVAPRGPRGLLLLTAATARSLLVLLRRRPRVTLATGGYVSAPAVVASWLLRVPVVLFLPDVVPGKAIRRLLPLARSIAVSTDDALHYLPRGVVTGYPVRAQFLSTDLASARRRFDIPADANVLCVFGGSLGARSLNQALARSLPHLPLRTHVIHVAGEQRMVEAEEAAAGLAPDLRRQYHLYPFLDASAMADALAAADIVVSRSGASTLGELPAVGTPAVLVPLPERSVHQLENARFLADRGAAVILPDNDLDQLPELLESLLTDRERLEAMSLAMSALSRPDAAAAIAKVIEDAA